MTADELRREVVKQAESWLGRNEADMSHREIVDIYNSIDPLPRGYRMKYSDPWCATFVSAVAQVCKLTRWIFPECSCDRMIALYKAAGRWMEDDAYRPKPGDIIMYDWQDNGVGNNTGNADHVGYVIKVIGDTIHIIEGNCANAVKRTTRQVNARYIRGYCLPDYEAAAGKDANVPVTVVPDTNVEDESKTYTVKSGDCLWSIAWDHHMTITELANINGLDPNEFIYPGQILRLRTDAPTDPSKGPDPEVVSEILHGKYGTGTDRIKKLTDNGYNPDAVQSKIDVLYSIAAEIRPLVKDNLSYLNSILYIMKQG